MRSIARGASTSTRTPLPHAGSRDVKTHAISRRTMLFLTFLAALLIAIPVAHPAAAAAPAKLPRARAIEFEERLIFRSPENPGFAAWVQLWQDPAGDLRVKFLHRRQPGPGERVERPPLDVHRWDALALPLKYDFDKLVAETVYMRSADNGGTW